MPLDEIVEKVDVMMLLRVQHERHDGKESFSKEGYHLEYGLTNERATRYRNTQLLCIQRQSIGMLNWQMN